jgi:large subunit ribosomal protein L7A
VRRERLPGVRSAERAVKNDLCSEVYVAKDAEERVVGNLLRLCREKGIPVTFFDSMRELGEFSSLRVGAAACAILKTPCNKIESGQT